MGRLPIHYAASAGHADLLALYLAHGMPVDALTNDGDTALMFAAQKSHDLAVETLLEAGASLNIRNKKGLRAAAYATDYDMQLQLSPLAREIDQSLLRPARGTWYVLYEATPSHTTDPPSATDDSGTGESAADAFVAKQFSRADQFLQYVCDMERRSDTFGPAATAFTVRPVAVQV